MVKRKGRRARLQLVGGPYNGYTLLFTPGEGTLYFRVGNWCGRYNNRGVWQNV